MTVQHKELAEGRWASFSLVEQMANIGSEVHRALNWKTKGNADYSQRAFERALELVDLSLDTTKEFPKLKEFARLREALVDYFWGSNEFASSDKAWERYFACFTYAARKNY